MDIAALQTIPLSVDEQHMNKHNVDARQLVSKLNVEHFVLMLQKQTHNKTGQYLREDLFACTEKIVSRTASYFY